MDGIYDVMWEGRKAGQASVARQGLYYRIHCRCTLPNETVYRLIVSCDGRSENLGVCVPGVEGCNLTARVPVKRIGEGRPQFFLQPKYTSTEDTFIPISEDSPFAGWDLLENGRFEIRNGKTGISITNQKSSRRVSPTGQ